MRVTFIGHASFLIQTAGLNILVDPVWSERTSPFSFAGPKRVNPPGIRFEDLPPIDLVLVTHNHYDHLDMETLKRLHVAHKPLFITPLGNDAIIRTGVQAARIEVTVSRRSVQVMVKVTGGGRGTAAIAAHLRQQLTQGDKSLVGNKGYRRYLRLEGPEHFTVDDHRVTAEERFAGIWDAAHEHARPHHDRGVAVQAHTVDGLRQKNTVPCAGEKSLTEPSGYVFHHAKPS